MSEEACAPIHERLLGLPSAAFDEDPGLVAHLAGCARCRALADEIREADAAMVAHVEQFAADGADRFDLDWARAVRAADRRRWTPGRLGVVGLALAAAALLVVRSWPAPGPAPAPDVAAPVTVAAPAAEVAPDAEPAPAEPPDLPPAAVAPEPAPPRSRAPASPAPEDLRRAAEEAYRREREMREQADLRAAEASSTRSEPAAAPPEAMEAPVAAAPAARSVILQVDPSVRGDRVDVACGPDRFKVELRGAEPTILRIAPTAPCRVRAGGRTAAGVAEAGTYHLVEQDGVLTLIPAP